MASLRCFSTRLLQSTTRKTRSVDSFGTFRLFSTVLNEQAPSVLDCLVTFHVMDVDGVRYPVTGRVGQTLVEACEVNDLNLIECDAHGGGNPSHLRHSNEFSEPIFGEGPQSYTSHVILPKEWEHLIPPASEQENFLLSFVENRRPGSRLGSQIKLTKEMEGLGLAIPERQEYLLEAN